MDATLPGLKKLDREGLQALLIFSVSRCSQGQRAIATQERLTGRESEIAHLKLPEHRPGPRFASSMSC
jgi:hypothetical protein